jgi:hypothetical protein
MKPHLSIQMTGLDGDLAGIIVSAANTDFGGRAEAYVSRSELIRLANHLDTFPSSISDSVQIDGGEPGSSWGHFSARFYCFDSSGHTAIRVGLQPKLATLHRKEEVDQLWVEICVEANQFNAFSKQLLAVTKSGEGEARLVGRGRYAG